MLELADDAHLALEARRSTLSRSSARAACSTFTATVWPVLSCVALKMIANAPSPSTDCTR
ncbi:MAG: hypothetical protein R3B99_21640 [Polyangiales bacterium]